MPSLSLKVIQLAQLHEGLGASFGEFAGWSVPMIYTSTVEEHMAVRTSVGIFDISHMGRLRLTGDDAEELLDVVFTKKVSATRQGFMSGPTLALTELARVIDDEMWYRVSDSEWLAVPNAAVTERMKAHLLQVASSRGLKVKLEDLTSTYAMLAIQGPRSVEVMEGMGLKEASSLKPLQFINNVQLGDAKAFLVSRSGWTGEDGFEVWAEPGQAERIYRRALELGAKPVGIAARDTLRIEMGFVLGGNEYGEDPLRFPCALSLRYGMGAIDWGKSGFIGETALRACRREGVRWVRVGLEMKKSSARFIPRGGYRLKVDDVDVGWVTSGTFSPVLQRGVGQAYIDVRYALLGESVAVVDERGRSGEAKVEDFPLIKRK
ncbi:MAG: glycine cleavage system aminomethyltransferase GcvT [Acidilobus sp.]